jgi:kynureninase
MRGPADLLAYRDEFPVTKDKVFLGSHTLSPLSRRARAAVERFLDIWEQKASAELVWFEDFIPEMRRVESLYAGLIAADPDEICLVPSVSSALSSLASCFDFASDGRNEIVLSTDEFPTDCVVWMAQERRGAKVVHVDGRQVPDYAAAINERTAVVSASRVSYLDGAMLDPHELGHACGAHDVFYVIDDFHGSGVVPLDVHATGAHALVCGALKYLLGGPGIAFLYVRSDVSPTLEPTATGWFAQDDFFAFDNSKLDRAPTAQRFAMGTPAPAAIYAAGAGLEIVHEVGVERIRERTVELTGYLIDAATDAGFRVRTPREPERRGAVVSFEVPDSNHVLERLLSEGVIVDERHGAIRACPHFFSSEDDIDALFRAVGR